MILLIELAVPVEKIPYIRTIEGRRFRNGLWSFPESSANTLKQIGLLDEEYIVEEKKTIYYQTSNFLRKYQKDIVNKALNHEGYGIFMDTGTGKTVCALEIAKHLGKTLVLCPLSVIETAWIDDCHKFYPDLKIVNCWGENRKQRYKALETNSDVYVMNYESFKILKNEIAKMNFECMIVDESSAMKNMTAQITSEILSMTDIIPRRYVLSGTPNPNSNLELFPQMKFVLPDLFGSSFYGWQATYFHQDMTDPHKWYQTQEDKERLFSRLSEGSVFLKKEECIDLPPKIFQIREYTMCKKQEEYYMDMVNNIRDNINQWSKFEFTAKLMKLREILSGFVINKDGTISEFKSNKTEVLKQAIEEIGDKPIIVWCQFQYEIETLAKEFDGVALTSKIKDRNQIIRDFKDGKIHLLFTHPKLLGKGLTFTNCTYNIYYSVSFSYEEFAQSQDRIHRIGQDKNVVDELYLKMGMKI